MRLQKTFSLGCLLLVNALHTTAYSQSTGTGSSGGNPAPASTAASKPEWKKAKQEKDDPKKAEPKKDDPKREEPKKK